jgi:hypothetical protein
MLLHSTLRAGARQTARWVAVMLVEANRDSSKPSLGRYLTAVDALDQLEDYDQAVAACQYACRMRPNDMMLGRRLKNLSAMQTMQRGKYQTATDFTESLDGGKKQIDDRGDLRVVLTDEIIDRQVEEARRDLEENPGVPGKIYASPVLADGKLYYVSRSSGVYVVEATIDKSAFEGVCNVGAKPTFGGGPLTVEVHLRGFEGDIYGKTIDLFFVRRLECPVPISLLSSTKPAPKGNLTMIEKLPARCVSENLYLNSCRSSTLSISPCALNL